MISLVSLAGSTFLPALARPVPSAAHLWVNGEAT
jgi:hypothetical protein